MVRRAAMLRYVFILLATGLLASGASADPLVGVPGSDTKYPVQVEANVIGQPVQMTLTGTALRSKLGCSVYAIASYVHKDANAHSAEALVQADCAKRLHLVMERNVDGKDLAAAFRSAIRLNYPEPTFVNEIKG